jgi:peptidoglycan hydrolase-like protein with peptidoglycan-binding domain
MSKRFSSIQRLQAVSGNSPPMKLLERGNAVQAVQLALISLNLPMPKSAHNYKALPDGIFGQETLAAVKTFQRDNGLVPDGIVGKHTMTVLDRLFSVQPVRRHHHCGNCYHRSGPHLSPEIAMGAFSRADTGDHIRPPTQLPRFMTDEERNKAQSVFGNSLNFVQILISDALGIDGRAFVTIVPKITDGQPDMCLVNWGPSPSDGTFFHELTHVWQSQHHAARPAFMANAIISQTTAAIFGGDAYAFIPGRAFSRYGAEQIAQQVERRKGDIISHIASFPLAVPDPANLPVPGLPFWETPGAPGVET